MRLSGDINVSSPSGIHHNGGLREIARENEYI